MADLAEAVIPACDLVNASVSLLFLGRDAYWRVWASMVGALSKGGRIAAMVYGERDASATDPAMTCPSPDAIRAALAGFDVEHWSVEEEDGHTALGEPHHFQVVELVARRA